MAATAHERAAVGARAEGQHQQGRAGRPPGSPPGSSAARRPGSAGSGEGGRRNRSAMPATTATRPAASRNEGSLTSSASSSGSPAAATRHTASAAERSAESGQADAPRAAIARARDRECGSGGVQREQQRGRPEQGGRRIAVGVGRSAGLRRSGSFGAAPESACCWSSIRVTPSRNQAPSTRSGPGGSRGVLARRTARSRPGRRCRWRAPRSRPARPRAAHPAPATRHHPVSASPITPYQPPRGCSPPAPPRPTARSAARASGPGRRTARPAGARSPPRRR